MNDLPGGAIVASETHTIMVVDHDASARTALVSLLHGHGYRVDACESAVEALERLATGAQPSLIVLELQLPELDGWEFRVRQLRDPAWAQIPLLAISSDGSAKARAVHAAGFFLKPIQGDALLSSIARLLTTRSDSEPALSERGEPSALHAGVAHEINNALAYVLGTLELAETKARELESRLRGPDAFTLVGLRQLVTRAQRGAERIGAIAREFERPRRSGELRPFVPPRNAPAQLWSAPPYARRTRHATEPPFLRTPAKKPSVLVVDDEPMICELVTEMLEEDYDVVSFTEPRAALATLLSGSFDVIVCDLLMTELSGMELYEQLASQRPELTQQIIFLSGGGFTETARDFLARVRRPQVKKPFHQFELLDAIEEQLTPKH